MVVGSGSDPVLKLVVGTEWGSDIGMPLVVDTEEGFDAGMFLVVDTEGVCDTGSSVWVRERRKTNSTDNIHELFAKVTPLCSR